MKNILFLILILSCQKNIETDRNIEHSVENVDVQNNFDNWQKGFELTHNIDIDTIWNKPVRFYLENKNCNPTAKDFYFGKYRPYDEPKTAELLALITTDDDNLRPFYRWILNKTILIQDGALGEYTGVPARKYAEKYPTEFFEYMDYDKSGDKYLDWTNSISYSGMYDLDDYKNSKKMRKYLSSKMKSNCKNCDDKMKPRIEKFANDCFPD
ncbi:hypothetical protein [Frigoriflavimonas asaccharolytica]|uniref:Uncharacterized protein n=1 Tax=Frigoriflavimonas asaccharolytica TaxID=2735899 RepID=A0A8J8GBA1_9FLAO|nr:hypothetical protein [Frigoriflavimonas asaccharolytica]NRS92800.1 hypothetical protein [Frigoriflavimonas asaccharolytica]